MEIPNGLEGLNSLLGVNATDASAGQGKSQSAASASGLDADSATLSSVASGVAQATDTDDVRTEKVAEVQAAIASGTYAVPASAVASKVVDAMLAGAK